jgi:diguanylate cyclase (GGDEF)-like protein
MPTNSAAAINSKILGWTIPKNYREVDLAFGQLKLGYYASISSYSIMDVLVKYWQYILIAVLGVAFLIINTLYIVSVNRKLGVSEKELRFQATHDALTGLPNRIMFYELAARFLHIALRDQRKSIILFLDLDRFKQVNDTHGHDVGDLMLKEVSKRMSNMLRDNDIIARIGGDEFLVMLSNIESVNCFESIMDRLIEVVTQPLTTDSGLTIDVGCSIGASHYPRHGSQLKDLIKKADQALYKAKDNGRGCYVIYGEH